MPAAPRVISAGSSDQGNVRGNNEDRIHIDDQRGIYMVVDGMGGQAAGEEAAEIAVKTMRGRLERPTESPDLRIREAIALANNAIYEAASRRPEWQGMACVLTVALVEDSAATIGHVGDSRLYHIRRGKIEKITRDHSPVGEREDSGELSEEAAMSHPRRNEVYRDVGSAPRTPDDTDFIEVKKIPFKPDSALLICSDGLSDVVPAKRILEIVQNNAGDCKTAIDKLIRAAVADGKDNVSVVLVEGEEFARSAPPPVPAPAFTAPPEVPRRSRAASFLWVAIGMLLGAVLARGVGFFLSDGPAPHAEGPRVFHIAPQDAEFSSIPEAINRASPGDTLEVAPGQYPDRILLKNGLHIKAHDAVVNGIIADSVTGASVDGLEVRGDTGIQIRNSNVDLDRVTVSGAEEAGVAFSGASRGSLRNSRIVNNGGPGVVVSGTASPEITGNYIAGNGKDADEPAPGIEFRSTAPPHLAANGIGNNGAEPLWLPAAPDPTLLASNVLAAPKRPYRVIKPGGRK